MLKDMTVVPRLYLKFVPPGERNINRGAGRSSQNKSRFKEMTPDSYNTDMMCAVRKANGSWKMTTGTWRFSLKLEPKKVKDIEAWCVKYDIKPESQRYQSSTATSYKVVIVTRPGDKDSDLYLADNPVVTASEGTLERPAGQQASTPKSIEVITPPIFAGRKPRAVEALAIAYCKE